MLLRFSEAVRNDASLRIEYDVKSESSRSGPNPGGTCGRFRSVRCVRYIFPEKSHVRNLNHRFLFFSLPHAPHGVSSEPEKDLHIVQLPRLLNEITGLRVGIKLSALDSTAGFVKGGAPHTLRSAD